MKHPRLIIPTTFEECLTYGQRQEFMWRKICELDERVKALEKLHEIHVELNPDDKPTPGGMDNAPTAP